MNRLISFLLIAAISALTGCSKVPITNRRQMKLLPKTTLNSMAVTEYRTFLISHPPVMSGPDRDMVVRVGTRIQKAVESFLKQTKREKLLTGYKWEFNLVNEATVNAWCMPGGKVVVYSGLLPVTTNEDGLAVVMGHEIAHAIANHGNERMSQGLLVQTGGMALSVALSQKPEATRNIFLGAYGVGAQVGALLPYSRLHESEADEMGLIFAAMAGYDPEEAPRFWERMEKASGGGAPPELLSTHPSNATRIAKLKEVVPRAKAYAVKYGTQK